MPQPAFDILRALAIGSQALGLMLIITLETVMDDAARPWQGGVLVIMVASALMIALVRLYQNKRYQKQMAKRRQNADEEEER